MAKHFVHCTVYPALTFFLSVYSMTLFAQEASFSTTVKASSEGRLADAACAQAFTQAREEAFLQFEESPSFDQANQQLELIQQTQSRRQRGPDVSICEVTTSWQSTSASPRHALAGTEQSITARYSAQCLDEARASTCWNRITDQARSDLLAQLTRSHHSVSGIRAIYVDFEGRQRDQYQDGRFKTTADGTFYFELVSAQHTSSVKVERNATQKIKHSDDEPLQAQRPTTSKKPDSKFDVSLSYTWDGNDAAPFDSTAISSGRLGLGIWADNRMGFVAFSGEDTVGIGTLSGGVKNSSASYQTTGIGIGVRLWNRRDFSLENHLYYVDAQPFSADLTNSCSNCTDRNFRSEDYAQTTVNLKTNSKGVNLGWMLTWKWLDKTANVDKLSGGWFVEVLF